MNARSNARSIAKPDASEQCTYGRTDVRTYGDAHSPPAEIAPLVTRTPTYGIFPIANQPKPETDLDAVRAALDTRETP